MYGYLKRQIGDIAYEWTCICLTKGNQKRETEYLLIAARNNCIKAKIHNKQQKSKCWLCGRWDKTVNHKIRKWSKLARKQYKIRHNGMGNGIHKELCERLKNDHTIKWYGYKLEDFQEKENIKDVYDFEILRN